MAILVDLSQIIMSGVIINLHKEAKKGDPELKNLIKHMVFNMLLGFKRKFGKEYGKLILCADSRSYWRKEYFPYYKGHRKHDREKSDLDWQTVFDSINEVKSDLKEHFPYHVIEIDRCEADDIIAVLCEYFQENELVEQGLFDGEVQPILVISSDGDFVQLQKYKTVVQWNNQMKKWVKGTNAHEYLIEHICTGDAGDNFPNILTNDEWARARAEGEEKARQTPFKKARLQEFIDKGIDACKNEEEKRNYIRNQTLADFTKIPTDVKETIVSYYINNTPKGNVTKLMNYFMKNRMKVLFGEVSNF